jgi:hypothetical protein
MSTTKQPINDDTLSTLPAFVVARLKEIAGEYEYTSFLYRELLGSIDHPYQSVSKQINLWIASADRCFHNIYLGGSACWICPDNHYIFFRAIPPETLPEMPDQSTWWVIKYEYALEVYQIAVRSEDEVIQDFEDL